MVEEAVWAELLVRYGRWLGGLWEMKAGLFLGDELQQVRSIMGWRERLVVLSGWCFSGRLDWLPWWIYGGGILSLLGG